jgi:hypothetical protein
VATPLGYRRRHQFPDDPERRDRRQRERTRIAADTAAAQGELPTELHRALMVLLAHTDDRCAGPIYPSLATIAREVHGPDHYDDEGGARTAGRWLAALEARGWLHRVHRTRRRGDGTMQALSNAYRVDIPDHLRTERHALEDAKRARSTKGRPTNKAPQNRRPDEPRPSLLYARDDARRRAAQAELDAAPPMTPDEVRAHAAQARLALRGGGRTPALAQPPP